MDIVGQCNRISTALWILLDNAMSLDHHSYSGSFAYTFAIVWIPERTILQEIFAGKIILVEILLDLIFAHYKSLFKFYCEDLIFVDLMFCRFFTQQKFDSI